MNVEKEVKTRNLVFAAIALIASLAVQIPTGSMIIGSLVGIMILYITGALKVKEADEVLSDGMRMMAFVGFVMISANGFSAVINATGDVEPLSSWCNGHFSVEM